VGEFAQAGFLLIIFFLGQRYFVEGIATTGRKG
jgi:ABC-type maltose transport system permease subunit